jgi:hypothetical protein
MVQKKSFPVLRASEMMHKKICSFLSASTRALDGTKEDLSSSKGLCKGLGAGTEEDLSSSKGLGRGTRRESRLGFLLFALEGGRNGKALTVECFGFCGRRWWRTRSSSHDERTGHVLG